MELTKEQEDVVVQLIHRLSNFYEAAMRELGLTDDEIMRVKINVALRQVRDMETL